MKQHVPGTHDVLIPADTAAISFPTWESGLLPHNISGLSSALKRDQVFRIRGFQLLEGPTGYPEFISAQCGASLEILPFHTAYISPPASVCAPSDGGQSSTKEGQKDVL